MLLLVLIAFLLYALVLARHLPFPRDAIVWAAIGLTFAYHAFFLDSDPALAARRRERMEALGTELGGEVHIFEVDLAKEGAAASLIAELEAEGLSVGTLINNAGFGLGGPFADRPLARLSEMIELNVRALTEQRLHRRRVLVLDRDGEARVRPCLRLRGDAQNQCSDTTCTGARTYQVRHRFDPSSARIYPC